MGKKKHVLSLTKKHYLLAKFSKPLRGMQEKLRGGLSRLGHLVKIDWLVADVTAVTSLDSAERAIVGVIVAGRVFGKFRSFLWSGSHFLIWAHTLEA